MEGIPVLEPLEHSVLVMALDSGLTEGISHLEPLEHSVLNAALVGRPMEGTPVLEPLEHSVLEMTLDGRPLVEMSVLEPLEHSVPDVAPVWGDCSLIKRTVLDPLEHSGLGVTDNVDVDSRPLEELPHLEPLEHSVLITALDGGLARGDGGPRLGPDRKLTFSKIHRATRNDDLVLGSAVPLPAGNVGRVALSPEEVRLGVSDVNTDENIHYGGTSVLEHG